MSQEPAEGILSGSRAAERLARVIETQRQLAAAGGDIELVMRLIDRSFVMRMLQAPDDLTIVRSIIDLGRNLGVAVVAEGVENAATWERLKVLGCTAAQGSHLSRPVPAGELRQWLVARRAAALTAGKRRTGLEPATSSLGSSRSTS